MSEGQEVQCAMPPEVSTRPYSCWFEPHPALGISLMDHLYNRLDGAYPNKWRTNFANQQAIDNWCESWVEAFEEEGITPDDIKTGLRVCRNRYTWPPSCAEFIQACKPRVDPVVAFHEAVEQGGRRERGEQDEWSSPAVYWAWRKIGAYDFTHLAYAALKARWESALAAEMAKANPDPIPAQMVALAAPGKTALSSDKAQQLLADFKARGMGRMAMVGDDGRSWARKILESKARGEPMAIALWELAEQALGMR